MMYFVYNGSLTGFLTAVFEVYERRVADGIIVREAMFQPGLYGDTLEVIADDGKAMRVWGGLQKKLSGAKLHAVYKTFLSERADVEDVLLRFIRHVFSSTGNVEQDYGDTSVLAIAQIAKQVHREKHRMEAFVRFQHTQDDIYYAAIEPDFNVLPLIAGHFKDRYADQHWMIYDRRRGYGIHYDKHTGKVGEVLLELSENADREFLPASVVSADERMYQDLWKEYFGSVNISARKNRKLHVRHVPARYWKYLTEKIVSSHQSGKS